jgi:hypothetical protein
VTTLAGLSAKSLKKHSFSPHIFFVMQPGPTAGQKDFGLLTALASSVSLKG